MSGNKPKLWVPVGVSYRIQRKKEGAVGTNEGRKGTKAFVLGRNPLPPEANPFERLRQLKKLAHQADYFIKPVSKRERQIRRILAENGIRTEPELEDLKDGRSLFGRAGHSLDSLEGFALFSLNPKTNMHKLERMVGKMHALGIVHDHLHHGNITIDADGNFAVIDLHRARQYKNGKAWKAGHVGSILKDLHAFSDSMTRLQEVSGPLPDKDGETRSKALKKQIMNRTFDYMLEELKKRSGALDEAFHKGVRAAIYLS